MTQQMLTAAKIAAELFIRRADEALAEHHASIRPGDKSGYMYACKWNSAVKRASLDLTRALAEMRKP